MRGRARTGSKHPSVRVAVFLFVRAWQRFAALAVLLAGIALIVAAVLQGAARASIVVIFPVLTGSSFGFLLGTLLVFAGVLGLFLGAAEDGSASADPRAGDPGGGAGGVVLIGPFPIFFGSWSGPGRRPRSNCAPGSARRSRAAWVAVGIVLTVLLVVLAAWFVLRG